MVTFCNMLGLGRLITVEPVLFLYMLCYFMSTPISQQLAFQKICQENYEIKVCKNLSSGQENKVHSKTSRWILYQAVLLTLPSIFSALILGAWSDKVGRKVILLLPSIGIVLLHTSYLLNVVFFSANANYLLIGIFVSGFFGGFATVVLGVFSYISDITDTAQRTLRVAIVESMIFLGGAIGNLVGGMLVLHYGILAAFGLCLGLGILLVVYVVFVLRESYFPRERGESNWAITVCHEHIKSLFLVVSKTRPQYQRLNLLTITFGVLMLFALVISGFSDVTVLYSKHSPHNFTPLLIGYFFAEFHFVKGIGSLLLTWVLGKYLYLSDLTIASIGAVTLVGAYCFLGFAVNYWMMFLGGMFALGDGMAFPCLRSRLSKQVESTELGAMFSVVASVEVLSHLLASVIFNTIYSYTVDWLPSFCYFLMSGMMLVALILLVFLSLLEKHSTGNPYLEIQGGVQFPHDTCSANSVVIR